MNMNVKKMLKAEIQKSKKVRFPLKRSLTLNRV